MADGATETDRCPRCGIGLAALGGGAVCPACALRNLLRDMGPDPVSGRTGIGRLGDYDLLGEVARGGMGVVYRARQVSLDRVVALKLLAIRPSAAAVARFHTEALAAARLHHPGIVPVHDFGEIDGRPYYSMEYVEGMDLGAWTGGRPMGALRAAQIGIEIARAVDHAHHCGVIHRDLKPANVLVDYRGTVRVTDFGLAKRMDEASPMTATGEVLGSPGFMSPEQADGSRWVDLRCDVYGIGAILYYLVTGRPPFLADTVAATVHQIVHGELATPRRVNPGIPLDLDSVLVRCLARNPRQRYASAGEVADELVRYASGTPVRARPVGRLERTWNLCRRRPAAAALALVSLLFLVSTAAGGLWTAHRRQRALETQTHLRRQAEEDRYVAEIRLAGLAVRDGQPGSAVALLERLVPTSGEADRRGFEWHWLRAECERKATWMLARLPEPILAVEDRPRRGGLLLLSPTRLLLQSPTFLQSGDSGSPAVAFDLGDAAGSPLLAVAPGRGPVAVAGAGGLWFTPWGQGNLQRLDRGPVEHMAWSGDGDALAVAGPTAAGGRLVLWNRDGREQAALPGGASRGVGWSTTASAWVLVDERGAVRVWNPARPVAEIRVAGGGTGVVAAAVSGDGRWVVTAGVTGVLRVVDVDGGRVLGEVAGPDLREGHLAVSRTCLAAVARGDSRIWLWRLPELERSERIAMHGDPITFLALQGDGGRLVSCSRDGTALAWQAVDQFPSRLRRHPDLVEAGPVAVFSPGGNRMVSMVRRGPGRGMASVISLPGRQILAGIGAWWPLGWAPFPGDRFLAWRETGDLLLADASGARISTAVYAGATRPGRLARLSANGRWLGVVDLEARLEWIDLFGARVVPGPPLDVSWFEFSPDSERVVLGMPGELRIMEMASSARLLVVRGNATCAAWSVASDQIVVGDAAGGITWYRVADGTVAANWSAHAGPVTCVALSPDGRTVVSGGRDRWVRLWRGGSGRELVSITRTTPVEAVRFRSDGAQLMVADAESMDLLSTADGRAGVPAASGAAVREAPPGLWRDPESALEGLVGLRRRIRETAAGR